MEVKSGPMLIQGNQACALGAMAAGCHFFAGYPITPSSEVLHLLSELMPKVGGYLVQTEDELSAIGAVIGGSFSGVKSMTATSGPGLALMTEMLGLASMAEIPAVIIDVQRGGPSTGLPTKSEQSDLWQALWGSHGDAPRVVLAPADVEDCFHATVAAFNIAEEAQMPVIVLSDQFIAQRRETLSMLTLGACVLSVHPWRWWLAGVPAFVMLFAALTPVRRSLRSAVLVVGAVGVVIAGLPLLDMRPVQEFGAGPRVWPEASDGVRLYVPTPARDVMRWLASDIRHRRLWPVGYLNLEDGLTLARTDAPVANARLASHIALTDEGPSRRWWLDALAAGWMILPVDVAVPEGMREVSRRDEMRLLRNHRALPVVSLADRPPDPAQPQTMVGEVTMLGLGENACSATLDVSETAWVWVSLAPVTGWQWRMDGEPITLEQGPGIVQYLEISAGIHRLEGRYRPPAFVPLIVLSWTALVGVLCWLGVEARRWYRAGAVGTELESGVHHRES